MRGLRRLGDLGGFGGVWGGLGGFWGGLGFEGIWVRFKEFGNMVLGVEALQISQAANATRLNSGFRGEFEACTGKHMLRRRGHR